mmetsp:Transcript_51107/g.165432  ORF Transcript_51107/g.165432 Transcript_51107/m.165432 type:complete len:210 (+) Transcript_51107:379-1008(+)
MSLIPLSRITACTAFLSKCLKWPIGARNAISGRSRTSQSKRRPRLSSEVSMRRRQRPSLWNCSVHADPHLSNVGHSLGPPQFVPFTTARPATGRCSKAALKSERGRPPVSKTKKFDVSAPKASQPPVSKTKKFDVSAPKASASKPLAFLASDRNTDGEDSVRARPKMHTATESGSASASRVGGASLDAVLPLARPLSPLSFDSCSTAKL